MLYYIALKEVVFILQILLLSLKTTVSDRKQLERWGKDTSQRRKDEIRAEVKEKSKKENEWFACKIYFTCWKS